MVIILKGYNSSLPPALRSKQASVPAQNSDSNSHLEKSHLQSQSMTSGKTEEVLCDEIQVDATLSMEEAAPPPSESQIGVQAAFEPAYTNEDVWLQLFIKENCLTSDGGLGEFKGNVPITQAVIHRVYNFLFNIQGLVHGQPIQANNLFFEVARYFACPYSLVYHGSGALCFAGKEIFENFINLFTKTPPTLPLALLQKISRVPHDLDFSMHVPKKSQSAVLAGYKDVTPVVAFKNQFIAAITNFLIQSRCLPYGEQEFIALQDWVKTSFFQKIKVVQLNNQKKPRPNFLIARFGNWPLNFPYLKGRVPVELKLNFKLEKGHLFAHQNFGIQIFRKHETIQLNFVSLGNTATPPNHALACSIAGILYCDHPNPDFHTWTLWSLMKAMGMRSLSPGKTKQFFQTVLANFPGKERMTNCLERFKIEIDTHTAPGGVPLAALVNMLIILRRDQSLSNKEQRLFVNGAIEFLDMKYPNCTSQLQLKQIKTLLIDEKISIPDQMALLSLFAYMALEQHEKQTYALSKDEGTPAVRMQLVEQDASPTIWFPTEISEYIEVFARLIDTEGALHDVSESSWQAILPFFTCQTIFAWSGTIGSQDRAHISIDAKKIEKLIPLFFKHARLEVKQFGLALIRLLEIATGNPCSKELYYHQICHIRSLLPQEADRSVFFKSAEKASNTNTSHQLSLKTFETAVNTQKTQEELEWVWITTLMDSYRLKEVDDALQLFKTLLASPLPVDGREQKALEVIKILMKSDIPKALTVIKETLNASWISLEKGRIILRDICVAYRSQPSILIFQILPRIQDLVNQCTGQPQDAWLVKEFGSTTKTLSRKLNAAGNIKTLPNTIPVNTLEVLYDGLAANKKNMDVFKLLHSNSTLVASSPQLLEKVKKFLIKELSCTANEAATGRIAELIKILEIKNSDLSQLLVTQIVKHRLNSLYPLAWDILSEPTDPCDWKSVNKQNFADLLYSLLQLTSPPKEVLLSYLKFPKYLPITENPLIGDFILFYARRAISTLKEVSETQIWVCCLINHRDQFLPMDPLKRAAEEKQILNLILSLPIAWKQKKSSPYDSIIEFMETALFNELQILSSSPKDSYHLDELQENLIKMSIHSFKLWSCLLIKRHPNHHFPIPSGFLEEFVCHYNAFTASITSFVQQPEHHQQLEEYLCETLIAHLKSQKGQQLEFWLLLLLKEGKDLFATYPSVQANFKKQLLQHMVDDSLKQTITKEPLLNIFAQNILKFIEQEPKNDTSHAEDNAFYIKLFKILPNQNLNYWNEVLKNCPEKKLPFMRGCLLELFIEDLQQPNDWRLNDVEAFIKFFRDLLNEPCLIAHRFYDRFIFHRQTALQKIFYGKNSRHTRLQIENKIYELMFNDIGALPREEQIQKILMLYDKQHEILQEPQPPPPKPTNRKNKSSTNLKSRPSQNPSPVPSHDPMTSSQKIFQSYLFKLLEKLASSGASDERAKKIVEAMMKEKFSHLKALSKKSEKLLIGQEWDSNPLLCLQSLKCLAQSDNSLEDHKEFASLLSYFLSCKDKFSDAQMKKALKELLFSTLELLKNLKISEEKLLHENWFSYLFIHESFLLTAGPSLLYDHKEIVPQHLTNETEEKVAEEYVDFSFFFRSKVLEVAEGFLQGFLHLQYPKAIEYIEKFEQNLNQASHQAPQFDTYVFFSKLFSRIFLYQNDFEPSQQKILALHSFSFFRKISRFITKDKSNRASPIQISQTSSNEINYTFLNFARWTAAIELQFSEKLKKDTALFFNDLIVSAERTDFFIDKYAYQRLKIWLTFTVEKSELVSISSAEIYDFLIEMELIPSLDKNLASASINAYELDALFHISYNLLNILMKDSKTSTDQIKWLKYSKIIFLKIFDLHERALKNAPLNDLSLCREQPLEWSVISQQLLNWTEIFDPKTITVPKFHTVYHKLLKRYIELIENVYSSQSNSIIESKRLLLADYLCNILIKDIEKSKTDTTSAKQDKLFLELVVQVGNIIKDACEKATKSTEIFSKENINENKIKILNTVLSSIYKFLNLDHPKMYSEEGLKRRNEIYTYWQKEIQSRVELLLPKRIG